MHVHHYMFHETSTKCDVSFTPYTYAKGNWHDWQVLHCWNTELRFHYTGAHAAESSITIRNTCNYATSEKVKSQGKFAVARQTSTFASLLREFSLTFSGLAAFYDGDTRSISKIGGSSVPSPLFVSRSYFYHWHEKLITAFPISVCQGYAVILNLYKNMFKLLFRTTYFATDQVWTDCKKISCQERESSLVKKEKSWTNRNKIIF